MAMKQKPCKERLEEAKKLLGEAARISREAYEKAHGKSPPWTVQKFDPRTEARKKCVEIYTKAIKICPEFADAWVKRSTEYYFLHDYKKSRSDAEVALKLKPSDPDQYYWIATPFKFGRKYRRILKMGMALCKPAEWQRFHLWGQYAHSYWYEGNFKGHVREFERLVATHEKATGEGRGSLSTEYSFLGMGYEALGQYDKAEAAYRRAHATYYDTIPKMCQRPEGHADSIVCARMHKNDFPGAFAALEEFRKVIPKDQYGILHAELTILSGGVVPKQELRELISQVKGRKGWFDSHIFHVGLFFMAAGRKMKALEELEAYVHDMVNGSSEWVTTGRWEIARAKEYIARLKKSIKPHRKPPRRKRA